MLRLCSKITITHGAKKVIFNTVHDVSVTTSIDNFTDNCTVKLPRRDKFKEKNIREHISKGDRIVVELGYNDKLETIFRGYVKKIATSIPVVLECENETYNLKAKDIKAKDSNFQNFDMKKFCNEYLAKYEKKVESEYLGDIDFNQDVSIAEVLNRIKSVFHYQFYFREEKDASVFYAMSSSSCIDTSGKPIQFSTARNIISSNLNLALKDEVKIVATVKSIVPVTKEDGSERCEAIEGKYPAKADDKANVIANIYPFIADQKELQKKAEELYKFYNVDTMSGSFTAFGIPFVRKGDVVQLVQEEYQAHNNMKFLVTGVNYKFGTGGYRQEITLGRRVE